MKKMKLWKHPSNYVGATWENYYCFLGRSRDSDELEESNFQVGLERLGGECWDDDEDNTGDKTFTQVGIIREKHWAVGWVEWIAIHKDTITVYESPRSKGKVFYPEIIDMANDMLDYLHNCYGILDEFHFSNLEYDNLIDYLLSEFTGTEEEKQIKIGIYFDELSDSRGYNCDDSDWELIQKIENDEEE